MTSSQSERQELQCSSKAFFGLEQNQGITRFLRKRSVAGWYPRMTMAMMLTQGCFSKILWLLYGFIYLVPLHFPKAFFPLHVSCH